VRAARVRPISSSISPRQVAEALGVSESSVKRWSDQGLLATRKTAGGHRKLVVADVLRFVREHGYDVGKPELLGLPPRLPHRLAETSDTQAQLLAAMVEGDGDAVRSLLVGLFVRGMPLTDVCDLVLAPALHAVGDRWEHGVVRVFEEHRAIGLVHRALHELRRLLPRRSGRRTSAIVATLSGDPYTIAITMAELALGELGWTATNLGPDTPAHTIVEAITDLRPRVLCLGINWVGDLRAFHTTYATVAERAREHRTAIVIGGPAATPTLRAEIRFAACCSSMRELADFCASLEPAVR
jgi:methanogenic corrinoid protein MtbC1